MLSVIDLVSASPTWLNESRTPNMSIWNVRKELRSLIGKPWVPVRPCPRFPSFLLFPAANRGVCFWSNMGTVLFGSPWETLVNSPAHSCAVPHSQPYRHRRGTEVFISVKSSPRPYTNKAAARHVLLLTRLQESLLTLPRKVSFKAEFSHFGAVVLLPSLKKWNTSV